MSSVRTRKGQEGVALAAAVMMGVVLMFLAVLVMGITIRENGQTHRIVRLSTASQAAEAGMDDYVAKLTQDHEYFRHYVHPGESDRKPPTGAAVAGGTTWTQGDVWSYPTAHNRWRQLANGYEYNLQIAPPVAGSKSVRITATGRRVGSGAKEMRSFEAVIRPATPLDFQRMVNGDLSYGATATTNGKVYVGMKPGQTRGSTTNSYTLDHPGTATADLYSEGTIVGPPTLGPRAKAYSANSTPNVTTVVKNPIDFTQFTTSFVDVKAAAQASGIYLNDTTADGWKVRLVGGVAATNGDGKIGVSRCMKSGGNEFDVTLPVCGAETLYNVPANGAIYSEQSVLISGVVDGRYTVVTNKAFTLQDATTYENPNDDVLGLIAKDKLTIGRSVPAALTWYAAIIVQTDTWKTSPGASVKSGGVMNFYGSATTNLGGGMTMFPTRNYNYDANLQSIQPPYFPVLEDAYSITFFREIQP